ncbi:UPF0488 protein C8orf33 homolog isoform X3 [Hemicordylus capensis]|uniref:UPF0488 protein C8orf33 homolog isoform X3 n=1 Tax=Hemicordylus capensis TaxID=884348 RepID=UPI0023043375|nr:UPF0488 protein C8orf33 homolog isoform X3 [Hemicordylus capensis]
MEEIPQGTFQDELDWCILQLETGLLRFNPTPKQAEETQRILGLLCSRKAPFMKKRQVMRRVFGDYRLKMAEERKRAAKAALMKTKEKILGGGEGGLRKKKKKRQPSKAEPNDHINGESKLPSRGPTDQAQQSDEQFRREVDWCVEQLELGLKTRKSTPKQMEEALRAIKTLRSGKAVRAKKCQVMRATFGDYKTKMAEERQKQLKLMQAASKAARIAEVTKDARRKSSRVFRKSVEMARRDQSPAESSLPPPMSSSSPGAADACPFVFTSSQEEFRFDFF